MKQRISKEGYFEEYKLVNGKEYIYEFDKLVRVKYYEEGIIIKIEKYKDGEYIGNEELLDLGD